VGVTARGVTAAGRTTVMTAIVNGAELLSTWCTSLVVLLSLGCTPATLLTIIQTGTHYLKGEEVI
jgi:hypothetical protein